MKSKKLSVCMAIILTIICATPVGATEKEKRNPSEIEVEKEVLHDTGRVESEVIDNQMTEEEIVPRIEDEVTNEEPELNVSPDDSNLSEEYTPNEENPDDNPIDMDNCTPIPGLDAPNMSNNGISLMSIEGEWIQVGSRWWYRHYDNTYTKDGWEEIGGKWYYFDGEGWMKTNQWIHDTGIDKWYWVGADGAMYINQWVEDGGKFYYCNERGALVAQEWKLLGGKWYYFDGHGVMVNGWQQLGGEWYYFDNTGAMVNYNISTGDNYTIYIESNGVWQYTVSLIEWNLVDSGKHLDWGGTSEYLSNVESGATMWNNYKSGIIRKDTGATVRDVLVQDINRTNIVAASTNSQGEMLLNKHNMSGMTASERTVVVAHEFGHALGLGHNSQLDLMYEKESYINYLSKSDKKSYDEAYRRYNK